MNSRGNPKLLNVGDWNSFVVDHAGLKHYVAMIDRPGHLVLASAVEFFHFTPETESNQYFHINFVEWQNVSWTVFSVPSSRHHHVVKTAEALAMNVCSGIPSMMFLGKSAMCMTIRPDTNEAILKTELIRLGLPAQLAKAYKGLEVFPGPTGAVHAIENNSQLLTRPLEDCESDEVRKRERLVIKAMSQGIRPSLRAIADYVYGKGRLRPRPT